MKFAIATVDYFTQHGFDTASWRKSIDGTKALVHLEYAKTLIQNIEVDIMNVRIYDCPSDELTDLLSSNEWTTQESEV